MFFALRQTMQKLNGLMSRSSANRIELLSRTQQADQFGRLGPGDDQTTALAGSVRYLNGAEIETQDGLLEADDCILALDAAVTLDLASDRVLVDGQAFQVLRVVPDRLGARQRWHCKRVT